MIMAELPEITVLARQMTELLAGRVLTDLSLGLAKPLNAEPEAYRRRLLGRTLERVVGHGKWLALIMAGEGPNLLIHPGMGMDLLALSVEPEKEPQFVFSFEGGLGFAIRFWWFGWIRLAEPGRELEIGGDLGPAPHNPGLGPAVTREWLTELVAKKPRTGLKSFLLNQKYLAGIGNFYVQDICFRLRAHPLTKLGDLTPAQVEGMLPAIESTFGEALERGMNYFEYDLFGHRGDWGRDAFLVGYQTGSPCPECGTEITKIQACNLASYICPECQPER